MRRSASSTLEKYVLVLSGADAPDETLIVGSDSECSE